MSRPTASIVADLRRCDPAPIRGVRYALMSEAADRLAELSDFTERVVTELAKHGWGDFHYGDQPQEPEIVAPIEEYEGIR